MSKLVTFGEIMGRCEPDRNLRFRQALPGKINLTFAGAEANVAVSFAYMGGESCFVTALPITPFADACVGTLNNFGVDTSFIVRSSQGRLGLFFVETGANQRPSSVTYDRDLSSISLTGANDYHWDIIFKEADWFHFSGITPALSKTAAEATMQAVKKAREHNVTISCDLNFRKKLWRWVPCTPTRELAGKTMRQILPYVQVLIGNEEDAYDVLGIQAGETDVEKGILDIERYPEVAKKIITEFSNITHVSFTLRESKSANHNNWGGMLYDSATKKAHFAPLQEDTYRPYQIKNIVDRVGGGDSFSAALLYALQEKSLQEPQTALSYAVAASCLCHSIQGDFNLSTKEEIIALMEGSSSGRVKR